MRLRPADATPLATRLAMELWPMPDGRELDAPQARLLEAVRWTPSSPREAERGDFTLERFWMHLTGLLSGISSVRRGNAGPDRRSALGPWTWQEFLTRDDIAGALQVLLTSGHADPVVQPSKRVPRRSTTPDPDTVGGSARADCGTWSRRPNPQCAQPELS